jgi:tRNA(Ile)-lysidine synthase
MADRVEIAFRRVAPGLLPEDAGIVVAVSGGADSVALLHLVHRLARTRNLRLAVAHLDHGLRRGSVADRRFVERLSAGLSVECIADRRDIEKCRRKGESVEEAARRVRRSFLREAARKVGAGLIATGHTLDDQAETVLMRLVRGSGPSALAGMAPSGPGPFVRPLLHLERADLRGWLERRGLDYREDPSNRNLRFDRNRVRRLVLPFLSETLNPKAARHLVEAAGRLREDAELLDVLAARAFERIRRDSSGRGVEIAARDLERQPPPLARRIVRLALEEAGVDPRRIISRHIEAVLRLPGGEGRKRVELPGKREAWMLRGHVVVR